MQFKKARGRFIYRHTKFQKPIKQQMQIMQEFLLFSFFFFFLLLNTAAVGCRYPNSSFVHRMQKKLAAMMIKTPDSENSQDTAAHYRSL